ncbi:hypothetical protein KC331_g7999 [Hortaea werneckii]|uniref:Uncharacterized protein n=1 Tax=Hortaea werneckii TaxID=91943 RepID=A0A3M7BLH0_HORWE|nr:hypothetical protein KC331_g7999 [Hortaea werneckii]KAI7716099.1 hypothetical protein KC353_g5627 [Hortaea werneckii]RMY40360.1 hypothetical protein D0865_12583 [Hortaea werneckii]
MAQTLRLPILASAALSICVSLAIIGCAGRSLSIFDNQKASNVWLLPIWPNHFDTRELHALIGTSAAVMILNFIMIATLFIQKLPTTLLLLAPSLLSTICALVAIAFPATLNAHAPRRDTLRSWTCRWSNTLITQGQGPPAQFDAICRETRFAFYTTIPLFLLQLLLLALAIFAGKNGHNPTKLLRSADVEEKGQSQHELNEVRQVSLETKSETSPESVHQVHMGTKGVVVA